MEDYPMTILPNTEIRRDAREQLSGEWTQPVVATLVFAIVSGVASFIPFGSILLTGPFALGMVIYYLRLVREGHPPDVSVIFDGFKNFLPAFVAGLLIILIVLVGMLFLIVPGIIAGIGLSQTFFIMADEPSISATDAMQESWDMMKGHKLQLFLLQLSFLPWVLLSIFTLFIGLLWLYPYMYTSYANFYLEVSGRSEEDDEIEGHLVMDM